MRRRRLFDKILQATDLQMRMFLRFSSLNTLSSANMLRVFEFHFVVFDFNVRSGTFSKRSPWYMTLFTRNPLCRRAFHLRTWPCGLKLGNWRLVSSPTLSSTLISCYLFRYEPLKLFTESTRCIQSFKPSRHASNVLYPGQLLSLSSSPSQICP